METEIIQKIYRQLIENAAGKPGPAILAIDGRCASGKSTLGQELAEKWNASLFHMDDFYFVCRHSECVYQCSGRTDKNPDDESG